jgi:hypothetical protein
MNDSDDPIDQTTRIAPDDTVQCRWFDAQNGTWKTTETDRDTCINVLHGKPIENGEQD